MKVTIEMKITKINKAFTLAEVLITLGIIGVVAALTLPDLINNTKHKELEAALKEGYSILLQGLNRMNADLVYPPTPDAYFNPSKGSGNFYNEFIKYFKVIYDCGVLNPDQTLCFSRNSNISDDINYANDLTYKTYTNKPLNTGIFDDGQFVLANGMLVILENPNTISSSHILISIDVNGKKKGPNKLGYDLFTFQLMSDGKLLPIGAEGTKYSDEEQYCSKNSNNNVNGLACAYKALSDPDYFKNLP